MHEGEVSQSCPTLSDPMDCSPPGSSVHGIFQARILEWGAIAFSGDWAHMTVMTCSLLIKADRYVSSNNWLLIITLKKIRDVCIWRLIPNSQSTPLPPASALANTSLFSMSVVLCLLCRQVHLCHILDSTKMWYHTGFAFSIWLTSFNMIISFLLFSC